MTKKNPALLPTEHGRRTFDIKWYKLSLPQELQDEIDKIVLKQPRTTGIRTSCKKHDFLFNTLSLQILQFI